jgi:hypothetical protein
MKKNVSVISSSYLRSLAIVVLVLSVIRPDTVQAQGDGPRFYWKGLVGTTAIPLTESSIGGNANPLDPTHTVIPGSDFQATMTMAGFAKIIPVCKRSAMFSLLLPMGRIASDVSLNGLNYKTTARGYGDPMLQVGINILGPKAIMSIPDMLRYKPGFSVDLIGSLAFPIGEYDNSSPVNIGQNRWYGRVGAPIVWQLGPWVPGRRTTLEFLPAVWIFGNNSDFVGKTMKTDPMIQVEGHLTHDFSEGFWGALDAISYTGGKATIDGHEGSDLNNLGMGGTFGYHVNDNLQLTVSYCSTVNDKNPEDLKMDEFRFTLIYGWHPLIEGMKRLKSE